jgi:hypothetical protein
LKVDQRAASVAALPQPSVLAREHRAVATELINERLQAMERGAENAEPESMAFGDLDASFVEVTPIRSNKK